MNLTKDEKDTIIHYIVRGMLLAIFTCLIGAFYIIGAGWRAVGCGFIGLLIGCAVANAAVEDWKKVRELNSQLRADNWNLSQDFQRKADELYNAKQLLWAHGLGKNPSPLAEAIEVADARPISYANEVKTIMFFQNGNVCAFNSDGNQLALVDLSDTPFDQLKELYPNAKIEDYRWTTDKFHAPIAYGNNE